MTSASETTKNNSVGLVKTSVTSNNGTTSNISGIRKAAILCLTLGEEAAASLFTHLEEEEVQRITRELASLQKVTPETNNEVMEEFHQLLLAKKYVTLGGVDYARRLLVKSFGAEAAKRVMEKVIHSLENSASFEFLQKIDPVQLSKLFQSEGPQAIAVILAHLDSARASDILQNLPESQRGQIALKLANIQNISQDTIRRISRSLENKITSISNGLSSTIVGGIKSLAEICNRLDRESSRSILEEIEAADVELAMQIRNLMVSFDDALMLDDLGIREILQRVDKKVLMIALKGTPSELQNRFFDNMSSRAVEMMKEEMEFMGQVKMKEVSAAQREVIDVMRELDDQGVINLGGEDVGDQYVN